MDEQDLIHFIQSQEISAELVLLDTETPTVEAAASAAGAMGVDGSDYRSGST